MGLKQQRRS